MRPPPQSPSPACGTRWQQLRSAWDAALPAQQDVACLYSEDCESEMLAKGLALTWNQ